jgi:hypothetical protein
LRKALCYGTMVVLSYDAEKPLFLQGWESMLHLLSSVAHSERRRRRQIVAQNTHPYTPMEERAKAPLEPRCQRMQGVKAHADPSILVATV